MMAGTRGHLRAHLTQFLLSSADQLPAASEASDPRMDPRRSWLYSCRSPDGILRRMIDVRPTILEGRGIRLEPMTDGHQEGLASATADGRLWELWYTVVPAPESMHTYVASALQGQSDGHMLPRPRSPHARSPGPAAHAVLGGRAPLVRCAPSS